MKTNQLRAMMLTVMLVITTLGMGTAFDRKGNGDGRIRRFAVGRMCGDGQGNIPWSCYEPTRAVQD